MQITSCGSARMPNSGKGFYVTHHSNEGELEESRVSRKKNEVCSFFCDLASVDSCTVFPLLGCLIVWLLEISISSVNKKE